MKIGDGIFKGAVRHYDPAIYLFTTRGTHQAGWNASQAPTASRWTGRY